MSTLNSHLERVVVEGEKHPTIALLVTIFVGIPTGLFIWTVIAIAVKDGTKKGIDKLKGN